ncbi:unnamed protein product [Trichobilharzia szidati]|nr:unnamed protein product [Trichobilharzia szidati]
MFPKGIQFANKPWECAVTKFHQKEFIEADIDSYTCLSSLISAKCFNKHNELDIHTLGLLISVIKEKFDSISIRRCFPHIFHPLLFSKLNISEDGRYSLSQTELINQLKQLTQFCTTISSCDGQLIYNLSQFVPAHFLFNWIQLAYCLTINEIAHSDNDKMDYYCCSYTTAIGFLFIIESKNVKQYDVFMKFIVDELWTSLKNFYLQAVDYLSKSSMITCDEELSNAKNDNANQQNVTEQDIIDCYYEEFGRLLKLARLTSNLNCPLQPVLNNQSLDKLTCLLFDRLATLCLYHSGITVHNHASVYHALFSEEHSISVNNWSGFWLKPLVNFM